MFWIVVSLILMLIGVFAIIADPLGGTNRKGEKHSYRAVGVIPIIIGGLLMLPACLYSQDVGEVTVIRNLGGSLAGHSEEAGFHWKAPWQSTVSYDTRNNLINFYKDSDYSYHGGSAEGKEVTVNDKSGASADIDIQVNYSIDPSIAEYLYSEYGTQTTFTQNYISNDLRSVAREQSGKYDTLTMLTDRGKYTKAVQDALTEKWKNRGITVEQVSVQDVRYPEAITKSYNEAQAAEVAKQKALNEQATAKVEAETKKIKAQGEADANKVLNDSLSENVLKQKYIDALANADQLIVTPDGTNTLIQPTTK
ncbi:prohibitin family protein [Bifidobacterium sp. SO1]|uniref:prohibitin family protein n=1 Tax=Bifidobacterium sp. SO1 TaxID=2809029 RepID=UPI001BDBC737|nr:prohibitin family protein [Bifidobacterium sp. SO1]MBT1162131.1 prohibitin family protein [Bifidobacterium sp. SO1]